MSSADRWSALVEALAAMARDAAVERHAPEPGSLTLAVADGEDVTITREGARAWVDFAGWREGFSLAEDEDEPSDDLLLDFVAAALFGELRVIERRCGAVRRRSLAVKVAGAWRIHAREPGPSGLVSRLMSRAALAGGWGRVVEVERSNVGRRRPEALADAGPTGLATAPWAGAAGVVAEPSLAALPIDGELDLHNFSPKEVAPLLRETITACRAEGRLDLRVVHGKGKGVLRRTVHALLATHPEVEHYRLGGHGEGSWGATLVRLRPLERQDKDQDQDPLGTG